MLSVREGATAELSLTRGTAARGRRRGKGVRLRVGPEAAAPQFRKALQPWSNLRIIQSPTASLQRRILRLAPLSARLRVEACGPYARAPSARTPLSLEAPHSAQPLFAPPPCTYQVHPSSFAHPPRSRVSPQGTRLRRPSVRSESILARRQPATVKTLERQVYPIFATELGTEGFFSGRSCPSTVVGYYLEVVVVRVRI